MGHFLFVFGQKRKKKTTISYWAAQNYIGTMPTMFGLSSGGDILCCVVFYISAKSLDDLKETH